MTFRRLRLDQACAGPTVDHDSHMRPTATSTIMLPRVARPQLPSGRSMGMALLLVIATGCTSYRSQPLDDQAVAAALAPPAAEAVRMQAANIHHPLLHAVPLDLAAPLGPDQIALLAVVVNPGLKGVRRAHALAQAQVIQAGILPNPQLALNFDHPVGGADGGTFNAWGAGLTWEVTALIGRDERIAAAQDAAEQVAIDVAWQEWQVALAARLAATRLVALDAQVELAGRLLKAQQDAAQRIAQATALGHQVESERILAEAAQHEAATTLAQLGQARERQRILLSQALGLAPGTLVSLDRPAFAVPGFPDARQRAAQLSIDLHHRRLDLLALAAGYQSSDATLRAAILAQFPRISLGLQQSRDNTNVVSTGFGLVIDLPIFDRNQGAIATADATRDKLFAEYVDRLAGARSDLALAGVDCAALAERLAPARAHEAASAAWAKRQAAGAATHLINRAEAEAAQLLSLLASMDLLQLEQQVAEAAIAFDLAAGGYSPANEAREVRQSPTAEAR